MPPFQGIQTNDTKAEATFLPLKRTATNDGKQDGLA